MMKILSFFDTTGNAVREYASQGADCFCFDSQNQSHCEVVGDGYIYFINWTLYQQTEPHARSTGDIMSIDGLGVTWLQFAEQYGSYANLVFGFPPCTDVAVCGAKHFASKLDRDPDCQNKAANNAQFIVDFANATEAPYLIENPISVLSTIWRKPDAYFHPWQYDGWTTDDNHYTKKTSLWTGGGFVMPEKKLGDKCPQIPDDRIHKAGPSDQRADFRSQSPTGFFNAVAVANRF